MKDKYLAMEDNDTLWEMFNTTICMLGVLYSACKRRKLPIEQKIIDIVAQMFIDMAKENNVDQEELSFEDYWNQLKERE